MDSLGSEIGQKMRSAVKAKLIELGTGSASGYIDDELPDYVMIMVANKRSRQQMIDDLTLFLGPQTEVFVNWLHQVLQKLEEVTLPAVSGKESSNKRSNIKQHGSGTTSSDTGKDKKDKKKDKKTKKTQRDKSPQQLKDPAVDDDEHTPPHPSLGSVGSIHTVFANQIMQQAKKSLENESLVPTKKVQQEEEPREMTPPLVQQQESVNEFDIPTISEIATKSALQKHQKELSELEEIQQRIKQAKKQLRSMGSSESEDEDFLNIKANDDDLEPFEGGPSSGSLKRKEKIKSKQQETEQQERSTTPPVAPATPSTTAVTSALIDTTTTASPAKKKSILERLGTRPEQHKPSATNEGSTAPSTTASSAVAHKPNIISLSAHRREERELYVPVFRRQKELLQKQGTTPSERKNRRRSESRERRKLSPVRRPSRRDHSPSSLRSRTGGGSSRERERERERERTRDRVRERDRDQRERDRKRSSPVKDDRGSGSGHASNGGATTSDIRSRIGSRVIVLPPKNSTDGNDEENGEAVEEEMPPFPSVVKVQPRPVVPKSKQPSKTLLLKAISEAQRSTAAAASKLTKTIANARDEKGLRSSGSSTGVINTPRQQQPQQRRRMLIEIPGAKAGGGRTPPVNLQYDEEYRQQPQCASDEDEDDIMNHVLRAGDDDVDDELQKILANNEEYIPEPLTVSIPGCNRSDTPTDSDGYVYVPGMQQIQLDRADVLLDKDPKFVVTLDGAYKKKTTTQASPSHTPPPPAPKPSIKDRIGVKVTPSKERNRKRSSTPPSSSKFASKRAHEDEERRKELELALQRRKERFSIRSAQRDHRRRSTSRSPAPPDRRSRSSPKADSSTRRDRERPTASEKSSSSQTRRKSSSSQAELNELLMQRTKELLQVDDSGVSSSPIYMSKSDYEKIEPNSSSRKRKRVSPIQFALTDEDNNNDEDDEEERSNTDGEYNHHRDREHRERKSPVDRERQRRRRRVERRSRSTSREHLPPEREKKEAPQREGHKPQPSGSEAVDRNPRSESRDAGQLQQQKKEQRNSIATTATTADSEAGGPASEGDRKSPTRKIKKLESSRKFDDVPQLLSSVSVSTDGLSKSKAIIKERCKYFPQCRQGDSCEFLHPSTNCKAFPACKFGDKCLYLHPMCKYDKTCHRIDCNYMHTKAPTVAVLGSIAAAGGVLPPLASSVVPVQNYKTITAKPLPALCKFYPHCANSLCPYYHPKMCRFGKHCLNKVECNFYHHELPGGGPGLGGGGGAGGEHLLLPLQHSETVPPKDKFKWVSPFSV